MTLGSSPSSSLTARKPSPHAPPTRNRDPHGLRRRRHGQPIHPPNEFPDNDRDKEEASNQHRAEAACYDCLRQLGVRFVAKHRLKRPIPVRH